MKTFGRNILKNLAIFDIKFDEWRMIWILFLEVKLEDILQSHMISIRRKSNGI